MRLPWGKKARGRRAFDEGVADEEKRIRDSMRTLRGERMGDDTEPRDMDSGERESYQMGRNHAQTKAGFFG